MTYNSEPADEPVLRRQRNQNAYYTIYGGNTYSVENRLTFEVLQNSGSYPANIYAYDPGQTVMSGTTLAVLLPYTAELQLHVLRDHGQKLAMVTCNGSNYPSYPTCPS